jgi:trigger factor
VAATSTADMTVNVERLEGSRVKLNVEAAPEQLDHALAHATRHLSARLRIPGFRPGKAPAAVVERMLGWEAVKQEAVEHLVPELWPQVLDQAGIDPIDDPELSIDQVERGMPVLFSATVTVRPELEIGDLSDLRIESQAVEVTDDEVTEAVEELRRRHAELVDVDRPVQHGDVLKGRLGIKHGDEVMASDAEERELDVDRDRLLPGIADGVIGLAPGDQRTFTIVLPEDFAREELRGQEATVDIAVTSVQERKLPEIDEALARLDGNADTVDGLRDHYRMRMQQAKQAQEDERYEGAVLEALSARVSIDIPQALIDREVDRRLRNLELQIMQMMGIELTRWAEYAGKSMEQLRAEQREQAIEQVRLQLVLDALAKAEGLEIDETQVEAEVSRLSEGHRINREQRDQLRRAARRDLLRKAAVGRAIEIARGE